MTSLVSAVCDTFINTNSTQSTDVTCVGVDSIMFHINQSNINFTCTSNAILTNTNGTVFNITTDDVIIKNCDIRARVGMDVDIAVNTSILNNSLNITHNSGNLIDLNLANYTKIKYNTFKLTGSVASGIRDASGNFNEIDSNNFTNYGLHISGTGIGVLLTSFGKIQNNVIDVGGSIAISLSGSTDNLIHNNTVGEFGGLNKPLDMGTFFIDSVRNNVTNNHLHAISQEALDCNNCDNLRVVGNDFHNSGTNNDVNILSSDNVFFKDNVINYSGGGFVSGLTFDGNSNIITIINNTIKGSLAGVSFASGVDIVLMENSSATGSFRGIQYIGDDAIFRNIVTTGVLLEGFQFNLADNVTLINVNGTSSIGNAIAIVNSRDIFINDSIFDASATGVEGLRTQSAVDRVVIYNTNFTGLKYGANFSDCDECNATNSIFSGGTKDITTIGGTLNLRLFNDTFDRNSIDKKSNSDSIWIYRPLRSNVTRNGVGVENINVTLVNPFENPAGSQLTDSNGLTSFINRLEQAHNAFGDFTYSPYNATATHINYTDKLEIMNITVSIADFVLGINNTFQLPITWDSCVNEDTTTVHNINCSGTCNNNTHVDSNGQDVIINGNGYWKGNLINYSSKTITSTGLCSAWTQGVT